ncbi:hypothetical protein CQA53_10235 [Helicobacter didelphidarum]|uniref:Uncharacterized protein n=1 Tax=Helicobacter didelphidarum TaxID=2040648 RepID=A0A3D8I8T0_9HELI|nr:hypothetical protein [Helicobacter didelphidarum]RDU61376.1 hypothetical protein CQA53_10235 [Helicobacter didelphidarum]
MAKNIQTIYVRLLDEDIDVFVPVLAREVFENIFEIIAYDKDLESEHLEFDIGDKVMIGYKELGKQEEKKIEQVALYKYDKA